MHARTYEHIPGVRVYVAGEASCLQQQMLTSPQHLDLTQVGQASSARLSVSQAPWKLAECQTQTYWGWGVPQSGGPEG